MNMPGRSGEGRRGASKLLRAVGYISGFSSRMRARGHLAAYVCRAARRISHVCFPQKIAAAAAGIFVCTSFIFLCCALCLASSPYAASARPYPPLATLASCATRLAASSRAAASTLPFCPVRCERDVLRRIISYLSCALAGATRVYRASGICTSANTLAYFRRRMVAFCAGERARVGARRHGLTGLCRRRPVTVQDISAPSGKWIICRGLCIRQRRERRRRTVTLPDGLRRRRGRISIYI